MPHREVVCYAESKDGITWTWPELGLVEFNGSKKNNIIWDGVGSHCFTPFKDTKPDCEADAKYKAISRGRPQGKKGLYVFKSSDGIRWKLVRDEPVITTGAFDSQNLAFWDSLRGEYRAYVRDFRNGRDICTCTAKDFVNWSEPKFLKYSPSRASQLYTNGVIPYYRAPHICARQGDGSHGQPVDLDRIMVRARVRSHLQALKERFSDLLADS